MAGSMNVNFSNLSFIIYENVIKGICTKKVTQTNSKLKKKKRKRKKKKERRKRREEKRRDEKRREGKRKERKIHEEERIKYLFEKYNTNT